MRGLCGGRVLGVLTTASTRARMACRLNTVRCTSGRSRSCSIDGYDVSPDPFAVMPKSCLVLARSMSMSWASFTYDLYPNSFRARVDAWAEMPLWLTV
ncbi:hypothetical protein DAEQUDRAFT_279922 [Daedalea quercina L-15889]|uniref:Uncharacterized protein n=1 Tax=Daedalea quercina L-15889 TaxID=1314783 RepID=A0A165Q8Q4_9APHY|nr:hypothetical protein DAEQUDRAFT_279922 [Daedalea quercina L-15889]